MTIPYALAKAISGQGDGKNPELNRMKPADAIKYATENSNMLRGKHLGSVLDSCRIGTITTCLWPTNFDGLLDLVNAWGERNSWDVKLYHEIPMKEMYSKFELPYIHHEQCPREEGQHLGTFVDAGGRTRCAHRTVKKMKPSFIESYGGFDHHSQMRTLSVYEEGPIEPDEDCEDFVWERYLSRKALFDSEPAVDCVDVCYAIIEEPEWKMPLETIFRRLNIHPETKIRYCKSSFERPCPNSWESSGMCKGHVEDTNTVEFTFDGWTMANYVQKWKEQGNAPLRAKRKEHWPAQENLRICSED